jgi:FAD/FMN-containing dehydrogenase
MAEMEMIDYHQLYVKYKAKYMDLQKRLNDPNFLKLKLWPSLACDNAYTDEIDADACVLDSIQVKENPFYETDKINGYTNNGFYNYWGNTKNKPINIHYIEVQSAEEISAILKKYNNKGFTIIVKNTGHDYLGRSFPKDNSIVLWTHKMRNIYWRSKKYIIDENNNSIEITPDTKLLEPDVGCDKSDVNYPKYDDGYLTIGAGVQWYKVFDYMMKHTSTSDKSIIDDWAMKGASNTVGAAGGWILDGGFGLFPKLNGMGVDNIICMKVVLANGEILDISDCSHPDIFRAFKGGGACNFGIVVDVTYKLLPKLITFGDIFIKLSGLTEIQAKDAFRIFFESKFVREPQFGGMLQFRLDGLEMFISFANLTFEEAKVYTNEFMGGIKRVITDCSGVKCIYNEDINISTGTIHKFSDKYAVTVSMQPNSTFVDSPNQEASGKSYTPSKQRWWTYESYNDHIVAFGSRYLLIEHVDRSEECAQNIINVLKAGAPLIQLEISKGMYGALPEIMKKNENTSVNKKVREAVGLMYIRSYIIDFRPNTNQLFYEYKKKILKKIKRAGGEEITEVEVPAFMTKFKYESNDRVFNRENGFDKLFDEQIREYFDIPDVVERSKKIENYLLKGAEISHKNTMKGINKLRELFGHATYINHSDCNEPEWETTFWDKETFNFLVDMKQKLDPNNIFNHLYSIPLKHID